MDPVSSTDSGASYIEIGTSDEDIDNTFEVEGPASAQRHEILSQRSGIPRDFARRGSSERRARSSASKLPAAQSPQGNPEAYTLAASLRHLHIF
jgi:hypothetical protein